MFNIIKNYKKLKIKILLGFLSCSIIQSIFSNSRGPDEIITNTVDHKNSQLNLYLDLIKYNTHEKLGILPYIVKNNIGIYLEVGTGGDPVADLLLKIPEDSRATIIASDVDESILKALPKRHPILLKYIHAKEAGPQLRLQQLDGTDMHCFEDNVLSGINASAVVHEIISYAGGLNGLDKFFAESFRVLKENGVLIYRDPEGVSNRNEEVKVKLNNQSIRLFCHIFLPKFLDINCGKLAKFGNKFQKYPTDNIIITFYRKNSSIPSKVSYADYLKTRSYEIDFSREYTILMPRGLCREIERHYLTYLHQCNPLLFVELIPTLDSNFYIVNYLAHSTNSIFEAFLESNSLKKENGLVDVSVKRIMNSVISSNTKAIEFGLVVHLTSHYKEKMLANLLKENNFDPNLYITQIKDRDFLLDYRIFGILYDYINENIFDENNYIVDVQDVTHGQWLKREGEETYVYYSDDELITRVAELSLSKNKDNESFVLCPISAEHNKFIPRLCYDEILRASLSIKDCSGYSLEIKEGKRVIHFTKINIEEAYSIFLDIIKSDPENYKNLNDFVKNRLHI